MSRYFICFFAILFLLACSRDYIEVEDDDTATAIAYDISSTNVNVDSIKFNLQYNSNSIRSIQIRKATDESPPTSYDGTLVCYYSILPSSCKDSEVSSDSTYYYSFFYELLDNEQGPILAQSKTYDTLSEFEGMHTTLSELISYTEAQSSQLKIILSGDTMDLYDDSSIMASIDGILITSLIYSDLNTVSPSKDANIQKIQTIQVANPTIPFFAVDYSLDNDDVVSSRASANAFEYVVFNRSLSTANIETLSTNLPSIYNSNIDPVTSLANVKNYIFLDKPIPNLITQLQSENYDLIIMTPYNTYPISELTSRYSESDIASIGIKPNGEDRLVFAYFDIGLAIKGAYYSDEKWDSADTYPDWLIQNYADNDPENSLDYEIKYWHDDWNTILEDMIDSILAIGYDGIVFGGTHHYKNFD